MGYKDSIKKASIMRMLSELVYEIEDTEDFRQYLAAQLDGLQKP